MQKFVHEGGIFAVISNVVNTSYWGKSHRKDAILTPGEEVQLTCFESSLKRRQVLVPCFKTLAKIKTSNMPIPIQVALLCLYSTPCLHHCLLKVVHFSMGK